MAVAMAVAGETVVLLPGMHESATFSPFPTSLIIQQVTRISLRCISFSLRMYVCMGLRARVFNTSARSQPIHLLGCGYNRLFAVPIELGHAVDVERMAPRDHGNVLLYSAHVTPLEWAADGGSITNMDVRFISQDDTQVCRVCFPFARAHTVF